LTTPNCVADPILLKTICASVTRFIGIISKY
jgi:hypothetical protein